MADRFFTSEPPGKPLGQPQLTRGPEIIIKSTSFTLHSTLVWILSDTAIVCIPVWRSPGLGPPTPSMVQDHSPTLTFFFPHVWEMAKSN